ncbi:MAG: endonuclease domain-containing protein [Paludibacteraceae bacterium]
MHQKGEVMQFYEDKDMFYGAYSALFEKASMLRTTMTYAETLLWNRLKNRQLGVKFRRQHPLDIFIADFYCHACKLVIEIDGDIHNFQHEYDVGRTAELQRYGIRVIRFTNEDVESHIEQVVERIKQVLSESMTCSI